MVFDIAGTVVGCFQSSKLGEDLTEWFAANVGKYIQTTTVRHSHDDALHTKLSTPVDDLFHRWNQDFTAFQTETFL